MSILKPTKLAFVNGKPTLVSYDKVVRKDNDSTIINFYTKVVFPSNEAKKDFYKKANIPANEEYITFDQVRRYFEGSDD